MWKKGSPFLQVCSPWAKGLEIPASPPRSVACFYEVLSGAALLEDKMLWLLSDSRGLKEKDGAFPSAAWKDWRCFCSLTFPISKAKGSGVELVTRHSGCLQVYRYTHTHTHRGTTCTYRNTHSHTYTKACTHTHAWCSLIRPPYDTCTINMCACMYPHVPYMNKGTHISTHAYLFAGGPA